MFMSMRSKDALEMLEGLLVIAEEDAADEI